MKLSRHDIPKDAPINRHQLRELRFLIANVEDMKREYLASKRLKNGSARLRVLARLHRERIADSIK